MTCEAYNSTRSSLAAFLFALLVPLLATHSAVAEEADLASRRAALLAKRPANLSKSFAGVEATAASEPEQLPPARLPDSRRPATAAPGQDYVIVDDPALNAGLDGLDYDPTCCPPSRLWVRAEYLLWWVQGFSTPALVTTSTSGTPAAQAGVLGVEGTSVLFGDERLAGGIRSGLRLTGGTWLNDCGTAGIQVGLLGLATDHENFYSDSSEDPILARPFYNVQRGLEGQDAELIAYPGLLSGSIAVRSSTSMQGLDFLLRHQLASDCCWRVDGLAGLRYQRLHDQLTISDDRRVLSTLTNLPVGTTISETDQFDTVNQFYGAQVGVVAQRTYCQFFLEGTLKVALGNTHSRVKISGESTRTTPATAGPANVVNLPGGLLAQETNIGTYDYDKFSVIPELGVTAGYDITPCLRATVGYTFLFWSGVARPGEQIDTNLNLTQLSTGGLVGIPRPQFRRSCEDVWAQGISFGIDYRF
ncbi:MAG: BBP7 family outer membrane beta-barrel protein [Pirellulaceae bacterium]|nr:BBP7 family outer membrane beta-barrel protein [Pirellulaceae bacterium]